MYTKNRYYCFISRASLAPLPLPLPGPIVSMTACLTCPTTRHYGEGLCLQFEKQSNKNNTTQLQHISSFSKIRSNHEATKNEKQDRREQKRSCRTTLYGFACQPYGLSHPLLRLIFICLALKKKRQSKNEPPVNFMHVTTIEREKGMLILSSHLKRPLINNSPWNPH